MSRALDVIEALGLPTDSFVAAVKAARKHAPRRLEEYVMLIEEISGAKVELPDTDNQVVLERYAKFLFWYTIQETVRAGDCDEAVFESAVEGTKRFLREYEYTYAYEDRAAEPRLDEDGNVKRKKGEKKEMAEAIYKRLVQEHKDASKKELKKAVMDALQEEVGMTKAGSQTYFYNCFKKFGR